MNKNLPAKSRCGECTCSIHVHQKRGIGLKVMHQVFIVIFKFWWHHITIPFLVWTFRSSTSVSCWTNTNQPQSCQSVRELSRILRKIPITQIKVRKIDLVLLVDSEILVWKRFSYTVVQNHAECVYWCPQRWGPWMGTVAKVECP